MCTPSTHRMFPLAIGLLFLVQPVLWAAQVPEGESLPVPLQRLHREHIAALQRAVEILALQSEKGAVDQNRLVGVHDALTDAICEGAASKAERIDLLTKQCAALNDALHIVQGRFEAGVYSELDVCQMRATLLRAQTRLLKEQSQIPEHAESPDSASPEARIRRLQHERIDTLQRAVEIIRWQADRGAIDICRVFQLEAALTDARLEAATTIAERIRLLAAQCEALNGILRIAEDRFAGGMYSELDIRLAHAAHLRSQIRLVQAQLEPGTGVGCGGSGGGDGR